MEHLRRYTHLSAALQILETKTLTLLDFNGWDDKNDIYYMKEYKRRLNCNKLFALCFSHGIEKYHMWKSFADRPDGVCINFDFVKISEKAHQNNLIFKKMEYKTLDYFDLEPDTKIEDIPFLKRIAFRDEEEYRIISSSKSGNTACAFIRLETTDLRSITINPWTNKTLAATIESTIRKIRGFENIEIHKSAILDSKKWKSAAGLFR